MKFTKEKNIDSAVQRDFTIPVDGQDLPCVIWSPQHGKPAPVLICMGHGGAQHKKTAGIRSRAVEYAELFGWATLAIDAPGHGDRISRDDSARLEQDVGARVRGEVEAPLDSSSFKALNRLPSLAVPEWKAALDAALNLDFVDSNARVGYWGVSMGTAIGVPFVATEPRVRCAIFGLAGMRPNATEFAAAAKKIEVPVDFVFQWEDAVAPREAGLELFNTFASKDKTMHINPGGHLDIPLFERDSWLGFFKRHLDVDAQQD